MILTHGTGEFSNGVTAGGAITAASGVFSDSLTVSGVPVATGVEFVTAIIDYVGNASHFRPPGSLNFVTLSGINRAHWLLTFNNSTQLAESRQCIPAGETGDVEFQRLYDTGAAISSNLTLDAPPPGVSQVLTINSFQLDLNFPGTPYRLYVVGTPV